VKTTGGALVAKTLKRFGVKRLFTIPGHQTLSVLDGCLEQGIEAVSTRPEAAAVHMATVNAGIVTRSKMTHALPISLYPLRFW
jgi:thiamine pyrophosphate-dependent acetolactate synthase large subunit-like protein